MPASPTTDRAAAEAAVGRRPAGSWERVWRGRGWKTLVLVGETARRCQGTIDSRDARQCPSAKAMSQIG
jgi:hypothetical protein